MRFRKGLVASMLAIACAPVLAADDRFFRDSPNSMSGFMPATDPLYTKECGSCHTPYLPGLLPARSWELQMKRMSKHFGEIVTLPPQVHGAILKYLVDNAADRSRYEGSIALMERVAPDHTPYRFREVPLFREMHVIILDVIDRKPKIRVRKLTNCIGCHQMADQGSFGNDELLIPGLTPTRKRPPGS